MLVEQSWQAEEPGLLRPRGAMKVPVWVQTSCLSLGGKSSEVVGSMDVVKSEDVEDGCMDESEE